MKSRSAGIAQYAALVIVGIVALTTVILGSAFTQVNTNSTAVLAESTSEYMIATSNAIANQDGTTLATGAEKAWIGNGQSISQSFLGMHFTGGALPANAIIKSASVDVTAIGSWISVGTTFYGDTSNSGVFSSNSKPSGRALTSASKAFSDNVKWEANATYSYDVTDIVKELVNNGGQNSFTLIAKGTGGAYGRKEIFGNPSSGRSPRLRIVYTTSSTGTVSPVPTITATATARATSTATATATATATPIVTISPTVVPSPTMSMTMTPVPNGELSPIGAAINGLVSTDLLGTCSAAVHDKYVTTGPDRKVYRIWHPQNDPSGCSFAHDHGDNPATSNIYAGTPISFGYAAFKMDEPKDEPHAGFKCFVHNKGLRNEEGTVALHDSYYCFHMGTGGASRFSARFHSMEFHARTSSGALMRVNGMADVGNVGSICDSPRQARTVQVLGCKIDSGYEIWENTLRINNKGNTVASAVTSTAVFDPILSMDPKDPARTVYSWSPEAMSQIYKFNDDRTANRGCDREAYSGPLSFANQGGSQVYYTDAYGNVVNGGALKQEISTVGMSGAGPLSEFGGLIMGYKGANNTDPQAQFKFRRSFCAPGLGIKN